MIIIDQDSHDPKKRVEPHYYFNCNDNQEAIYLDDAGSDDGLDALNQFSQRSSQQVSIHPH